MGMDACTASETAIDLTVKHAGQVEYTDFVAMCISTLEFWREKGLHQVWRELDKENKSWVSTADFVRKLQGSLDLPVAKIQAIASMFDPARSGRVYRDAFKARFDQSPSDVPAMTRRRDVLRRTSMQVEKTQERAGEAATTSSLCNVDSSANMTSLSESNAYSRAVLHEFVRGELVDVWSNAKQAWVKGQVEEIFAREFVLGGVHYPSGALRISFDAGGKWLGPEHTDLFRKRQQKNTPAGEGTRRRLMNLNGPKTYRCSGRAHQWVRVRGTDL